MAGVELGTAYVNIVSSAKGLGKSITDQFRGVDQQAQQAGTSAGAKFSAAVKGQLKTTGSGLQDAMRQVDQLGVEGKRAVELLQGPPQKLAAVAKAAGRSVEDVRAELDKTSRAAVDAGHSFETSGDKATSSFKKLAAFAAGAFAVDKLKDFFGDAIQASSDLQQTVSKSSHIFGDQAQAIENWSKTSADAFGLSQAAALEAAATFGDMFRQLGFAGTQAASMSQDVVQLAADLGSFNDVPTGEVLDDIAGAMRGEYDALQRLIPNISAARVQQEAMTETGKTNANALTAQEKAAATLAIIHKDGIRASGDFARSTGQLAIEQQKATARFENAKAEIGDKLLPVMTNLTEFGSDVMIPMLSGVADVLGVVVDGVTGAVKWFGDLPGPVKAGATALAAYVALSKVGFFTKMAEGAFKLAWNIGLVRQNGLKASGVLGSMGKSLAKGGALAGGAVLVGSIVSAFQKLGEQQQQVVDGQSSIADALDKSNGKWTEQVQLAQNSAIEQTDFFKDATNAGIDYQTIILGLTGSQQDYQKLLDKVARSGDFNLATELKQIEALRGQRGESEKLYAARKATLTQQQQDTAATTKGTAATDADTKARNAAVDVMKAQADALKQGAVAAQKKADADDLAFNKQRRGTKEVKLSAEELQHARDVAAKYGDSWQRMGGQVKVSADAVKDARSPVDKMSDAVRIFNDHVSEGDTRLKFFTISLDRLAGRNVSAEEATKLLNDQVRDVEQAFKDATKATNGNVESLIKSNGQINTVTQAGSDLYDSVSDFRNAYDTATTAAYQNAVSSGHAADALKDARRAADSARDRFLKQADALGINRDKAEKMADAMGILEGKKLTDKQFTIDATDNASPVVDRVAKKIRDLPSTKNVAINVQARALRGEGITSSFSVANLYMAEGGWVTGGIPGKDSVPRILMPGEAVIPTDIAAANKALIDAMLSGSRAPSSAAPASARVERLPAPRSAPLIGAVYQQPGQSVDELAGELGRRIMFHAPVMAG